MDQTPRRDRAALREGSQKAWVGGVLAAVGAVAAALLTAVVGAGEGASLLDLDTAAWLGAIVAVTGMGTGGAVWAKKNSKPGE